MLILLMSQFIMVMGFCFKNIQKLFTFLPVFNTYM